MTSLTETGYNASALAGEVTYVGWNLHIVKEPRHFLLPQSIRLWAAREKMMCHWYCFALLMLFLLSSLIRFFPYVFNPGKTLTLFQVVEVVFVHNRLLLK